MPGLEGTITTPFGAVQKKTALLIGGGAVLILGIVWYRGKKQSNLAAIEAAGASVGINPATGYIFGSPEDAAALANQAEFNFPNSGGGGGGGGGAYPPGTGYRTNSEWTQQVIEYLTSSGAIEDPSALSAALGKYITGSPATDAQKSLIEQAIAAQGYPPVAGPSGYPPSINQAPTPVTPPTPAPTPAPAPAPAPALATTYLLKAKENIYDVAYLNGTDLNTIKQLNPGLPIKWEWRSNYSETYGNVPYVTADTWIRLR